MDGSLSPTRQSPMQTVPQPSRSKSQSLLVLSDLTTREAICFPALQSHSLSRRPIRGREHFGPPSSHLINSGKLKGRGGVIASQLIHN
eukprot:47369-Eustigmatos_ZCMA.PRE.1